MGLVRWASAILLAGTLGGCAVGPDFRTPAPPDTDRYLPDEPVNLVSADIPGGDAQRIVQGMDIPGQWWQVFQSQPLNGLIERSLRANPDIEAAAAGLRVAQQTSVAQRASLFPTVTANGAATQYQSSPNVLSAPTAYNTWVYGLFSAGFSIVYAPDVWGGVRRAAESAQAQAENACFLLEAAYLSLASNVVVSAITEASLRAQIDATQRIVNAQRETLEILRRQEGLGAVTGADVAAQEAAVAQSEAVLPPLQKALAQQRNLLVTLTGSLPGEVLGERFDLSDLVLPPDLPLSLPARLVEQRPDVRAAEATMHAAAAQIGVATANQLPQISLTALIGSQSLALGMLFSNAVGPANSAAGGSLVQTLLDGGALQARKRAAQAAFDQARAQYRSTVLQAFRNVADTLRALEFDAAALKANVAAERAALTSLNIARRRLELGDTTYVIVLVAELTYQQTLLARVQAQAARLIDTAALFQALGGGWWNRDDGTPAAQRAACKPPRPRPPTAAATQ